MSLIYLFNNIQNVLSYKYDLPPSAFLVPVLTQLNGLHFQFQGDIYIRFVVGNEWNNLNLSATLLRIRSIKP